MAPQSPQPFAQTTPPVSTLPATFPINPTTSPIKPPITPSSTPPTNITLDDTSPLITYSSFSPVPAPSLNLTPSTEDYNTTLSYTTTPDATLRLTFTGTSLTLIGVTCPACGPFTPILDARAGDLVDTGTSVVQRGAVLWTSGTVAGGSHTFELICGAAGQRVGVVVDAFVASGPSGAVGFG